MANKAVAGKCIFNVPKWCHEAIAFLVFLAKKAQFKYFHNKTTTVEIRCVAFYHLKQHQKQKNSEQAVG
jgi:hypothetical protein